MRCTNTSDLETKRFAQTQVESCVPRSKQYLFRDLTDKLGDTQAVLCSFLLMSPLPPVTEHQNYFGIDENLGPVAVSIRREKVEDAKEKEGSQFNYRVAFRTSEVMAAVCRYCPGLKPLTFLF